MHNTIKRLQARSGSGFTLIELLVVIAILAILSGVVVFAVGNSTANARQGRLQTDRASIITARNAARHVQQGQRPTTRRTGRPTSRTPA
ncbi:MAG: type II secretion system protein [Candidatus Microthrix sp.]|nr:type II secretion system protein [Candidatus Microthrix sp.]